jgi:LPS sulfotransferase NodH
VRTNRAFALRRRIWRVRRSVPRIARPLSRVLPAAEPPARPVLVLGCPRSGTTALYEALRRSPELRSVQREGHILWDEFHNPRERGWDSDGLTATDVHEREREYVYTAIRMFVRGARFLDKTPESCLRVGYLDSLFPDATFVFLRRRAAPTVSSLVEAWKARPRFVKYRLPETLDGLGSLSGNQWSFALVPGWRELRHASLEEICARQYVACNEAVLDARPAIDGNRWIDVRYEDLVSDPGAVLRSLCAKLELELVPVEGLSVSRTALGTPGAEKWRERETAEAVERILPLVADTEQRLGYR